MQLSAKIAPLIKLYFIIFQTHYINLQLLIESATDFFIFKCKRFLDVIGLFLFHDEIFHTK